MLKKYPPQVKYIVGNEACERFSYYGMRAILITFMTNHLLLTASNAEAAYHIFAAACYLTPLLGGWISDRFLGKYRTIMYLSLFYCLGHGVLAMWDTRTSMYWGLALIALGSGGIKPCVSAYVGDQFTAKNKHLLEKVFDLFYWSINFGAFFSSLLTPWILIKYGSGWAFGVPGILMGIATLVFWMGRKQYVHIPPTGKTGEPGVMPIVWYSLTHMGDRKPGQKFLDIARAQYKESSVEGARAALDIFKVFFTVSLFWALFDQTGSTWVLQAEKMNLDFLGIHWEASQIQALNPIMVLSLIPVFAYFVYPMVEKLGIKLTPLRKMSTGMVLASVSFACIALIQVGLDAGHPVNVGWQVIPYLILTCSEIMVSITGLEFAYTQAPRAMKSSIMSFWLVTVFIGNMLAAVIAKLNVFQGSMYFWFYTVLMFAVGLLFIFGATKYKVRNYVENEGASPALA